MDRHLAKEARRAHKSECYHERKEARLESKAARQAIKGHFLGAAISTARANSHHCKAERAHVREVAATSAMIHHHHGPPHHGPHHGPSHHHCGPPQAVTVTTMTYPGVAATAPPAGFYTPPPPYSAVTYPTR